MTRTDEIDPAGADLAAPPGAGQDEPEELLVEEILDRRHVRRVLKRGRRAGPDRGLPARCGL